MRPDASTHRPDPDHLRRLIRRAEMTQREVADRIGVPRRTLQSYLSGEQRAPYPVQYCLERLAAFAVMADTDGRDFQGAWK